MYSELENNKSELRYFFEAMNNGWYSYEFFQTKYLIPKAKEISKKLDSVLHSEGLSANHKELVHYALRLLEQENPKEDVEYFLGIINLEENIDLNMKRVFERNGIPTTTKQNRITRMIKSVLAI